MLTIIEQSELEALRNASRKALTSIIEDAEFYYERAEQAQDLLQRQKSRAAGDRRRTNAENLSAYINRLEQLLAEGTNPEYRPRYSTPPSDMYDPPPPSLRSRADREYKRLELLAYCRDKFGESTEGQWRNGEYIGNDPILKKKLKKRTPQQ